jgi:hypothetical protein
MIRLTERGGAVEFAVRVVPRAGRTHAAGVREGALVVRVASAPVEGAANDALVAYLAAITRRPKRDVTIVSGEKSRNKRLAIAGLTARELAAHLSAILPP